MSSLVILAASVFEISCEKTDRQTDRQRPQKTVPPRLQSAWVTRLMLSVSKRSDPVHTRVLECSKLRVKLLDPDLSLIKLFADQSPRRLKVTHRVAGQNLHFQHTSQTSHYIGQVLIQNIYNRKKPALTRAQRPTPAMFL